MSHERWKKVGQRVLVEPVVRAGARAVVSHLPLPFLLHPGRFRLRSRPAIGGALFAAFAIGAAAGAGLILFLGPGSQTTRDAIASGFDAARDRVRRANRTHDGPSARIKAAAFATATRDHDDGHKSDHDEHGRPRRRHVPRA